MTILGLKVLVVDDEIAIQRFLRVALNGQGFIVSEAATGQSALDYLVLNKPDLVILDLGLPDIDGVEVTRRLREWAQIPVIILSVREQEEDKIAALDAGADDYLTKPFGMGELLARIRTVMRRQNINLSEPVYTIGKLTIDLANRLVSLDNQEIQLTPTEYDILRTLVLSSGKVLTNRQLLRKVWGEGYDDLHILRVNISNLRHKIEPDPSRPTYLHTEPGVGYRLKITDNLD
jgi:two-component system, OmpR family, KDP operon response regulator KdpE